MISTPARPVQGYDNFGKPLTSFAEGGPIERHALPAGGKWHKVATIDGQARLKVLPGGQGVLYTTERASPGIADGDAAGKWAGSSESWPAGAFYPLSSAFALDLWFCADPDTSGNDPVVTVAHGAKDL